MPIIKIRRGTTTQWNASSRVLQVGELGIDTTLNKIKAGNGINVWSALPYLTPPSSEVEEIAQDAVAAALSEGTHSNITVTYSDNDNSISLATGPDVVTTTSLNNTLTDPSSGYVSIADVGQADGVASLGPDGKIPDSEIPSGIARDSEIPSLTGYATEAYVNTAVSNLVDSAPSTLDTLNELATALGNDANFSTTITNSIGGKVSKSGGDTITAATASTIPLKIQGAASQSASLQQWQNSAGTVLSKIDSSGAMYTITAAANTNTTQVATTAYVQTELENKLNITEPSVDYYIANSGSGAYLVNGVSNGTIYFEKGKKYRIHVNASGHPFWIQTSSGAYNSGSVYNTGITNNGTQNGHILVELASNAPQLYYACQYHSSMVGSIVTGTTSATYKALADLSNVDNTSDANKPVSTATQTALDLKLNIIEPSVDYYVTNSGSGTYLVNGVSNGLINFEKGKRYRIYVNASGHPFWIQTVSGAYSSDNVYSTGITGNGTQVGSIVVELPQNAPAGLYYACQFHSSMVGAISVKDAGVQTTTNPQSGSYTVSIIDSDKLIEMSGGGTLTITDSSSFPTGFTVNVLQTGSSQVTIAGNGFTVNGTPGLKLRAQWSSATLVKRGSNSWVAMGDLSA